MSVCDGSFVIDMQDPQQLETVVDSAKPDFIVPEIESICIEKLFEFEKQGITVVPSANAVNVTMNRKALRDLANQLGLRTAKSKYIKTVE